LNFLKSSATYVGANVINAAVPFLLLPILTEYLSPSDYGILTIFISIIAVMTPLISLNTDAFIQRKFFDKVDFSQSISVSIIITSFLFLLTILFILKLNENYVFFGLSRNILILAILFCFTQFFINILLIIFQVKNMPVNYGSIQISYTVLNLVLSIVGVVIYDLLYVGRILGYSISSFIIGFISLLFICNRFNIKIKISSKIVKEALLFGGGLLPHTIGNAIIVYSVRFFVLEYESLASLGIFYTTVQVCSIFSLLFVSVNTAYVPWLFKQLNKNDSRIKQKLVGYTYFFIIVSFFLILIFNMIAPFLIRIFLNINYHDSIDFLLPVSMAFLFQAMYFAVTNYIIYTKKTIIQSICTFTTAILGIVYNFILVKKFGLYGASYAFALTYFTLFFSTWLASIKIFRMPWLKPVFNYKINDQLYK
tara:strand:- start:17512 stop:18780 length:1269 start_codon:yes stop_codon:yes gene_type:complete